MKAIFVVLALTFAAQTSQAPKAQASGEAGVCFRYRDCDARDPNQFRTTFPSCFQQGGQSFLSDAGVCTNR